MKLFKKLSAVAVAAVMGCSVFAFTACNPDDGNGGNGGNGGSGSGAVTGENAGVINGALDQEVTALTANFNVNLTVNDAAYNYVNGVKTTMIENSDSTSSEVTEIALKADLGTGNLDVDYQLTEGEGVKAVTSYTYFNLRSGHLFMTGGEEEIKDFSKETFMYIGALKDFMEIPADGSVEIPDAVLGALENVKIEEEIGNAVKGVLGAESYTVMALANAFNALTVANGKATADLNKAIYNAFEAVKDFLDDVTLETTVGDVLNNATIKGVLTPFINLIAPADLVKAVKDNLKAPEGADATTKAMYEAYAEIANSVLVDPNANETTWDYILRVIGSEELLTVVNEMLQAQAGSTLVAIDKTIDKWTLGNVLGLAGVTEEKFDATIAEVKTVVAAVAENITQTSATIESSRASSGNGNTSDGSNGNNGNSYVDRSNVTTFENLKFVYTLNNNEITEQAITGKVTVTEGHTGHSDDSSTTSTVWSETVTVTEIDATIKYEESVTLADISEAKTLEMREVYTSETKELNALIKVISNVDAKGNFLGITVKYNDTVLEFDEDNVCVIENPDPAGEDAYLSYENDYGTSYDFYSNDNYIGTVGFESETVMYANTVKGILAGTASTLVTE